MARVWIELDGEQARWGPTRIMVAKLSRDGYVAQVLIGRKLTPSDLLAIGRPPATR